MSACGGGGGGGGGGSSPATPAPPELHITPKGGDPIATNGAGLLGEEIDGSSSPVALGTIGDDKNTNGEAYYKLAEDDDADGTDNAAFEIIGDTAGAQILQFKGTYSGDLEGNDKLTLKIIRYNNKADAEAERNPQILDYIVNLINFDEALTITNADGDIIASDGEGLLPENYNGDESAGGSPFELGEIGDNGEISLGITYRLADIPANADYQLERADEGGIYTYKLYYTGKDSGDFEAKDFLIVDVIRTIDGTDQSLKYLVNLTDVAPDITANEADGTTEIDEFIAAGTVIETMDSKDGVPYPVAYKMAFSNPNLAEGETLTIEFVSNESAEVKILPQYDANDSTKLIGFQIAVGGGINPSNIENVLNDTEKTFYFNAGRITGDDQDAKDNFDKWLEYVKSVTYIGERPSQNPTVDGHTALTTAGPVTLTARATIEVNENTPITEVIADFSSADLSATYSLAETDDYAAFTIDETTGALTFKTAPDYEAFANVDKNNFYKITVTADDGTNTETKHLLVIVKDVTGDADTTPPQSTGANAAESMPHQNQDPHQWQPDSYNGDSDMIDLPDTSPDIL